ncbi:MAG TPA: alpha/beta hydrolase [Flavobacterium sp.]|jgi:hypothetical protein
MKKLILSFFLSTLGASAQDITGDWYGTLEVPGTKLRVVLHIQQDASGYSATMDSPDQGATGVPITTTRFISPMLTLEVPEAQIKYTGTYQDQTIEGTFVQGTASLKLDLTRQEIKLNRPQQPKPPFPYVAEEVSFTNLKENFNLAGTLTLPDKTGKHPVVILISGSGQQDRDGELLGHKMFLVLADHLTRNGIAVLRYDDRGAGKSGGNPQMSTSADFADDAAAAIEFLKTHKNINTQKMGLIGHSEGGIIAPMLASSRNDVAFVVLMAAPGVTGDKLLLLQNELVGKAFEMPEADLSKIRGFNTTFYNLIRNITDDNQLKHQLTTEMLKVMQKNPDRLPPGTTIEQAAETQVSQLMLPWTKFFIRYDPAVALQNTKCPVMAINGSTDVQVASKQNLPAIAEALRSGGNENVTIQEFPGVNHLFQESATGSPADYKDIEQTISPLVLSEITNWIKQQ